MGKRRSQHVTPAALQQKQAANTASWSEENKQAHLQAITRFNRTPAMRAVARATALRRWARYHQAKHGDALGDNPVQAKQSGSLPIFDSSWLSLLGGSDGSSK